MNIYPRKSISADEFAASLKTDDGCCTDVCGCTPSKCCPPPLHCDCCKVSIISSGSCCCTDSGGSGSGSIIPLASGRPITITTSESGSPSTYAVMGFGSSATSPCPLTPTIDASELPNFAFSIPRDGTITTLSGFFSLTADLVLPCSSVTVHMTLYQSAHPSSNAFLPMATAALSLPPLSGVVPAKKTLHASLHNLSIPVKTQSRLLLVISASATGATLCHAVSGYVSAGIAIR